MTIGFLLIARLIAAAQSITAISGGTLIDGTGRAPVPDAVVFIQGDRIIRLGSVSSVSIPPGARVIHAGGKFILPGLIDTHVHLEMVGLSDIGELPTAWTGPAKLHDLVVLNARLDLIAGITTVRDLGSTELVLAVRNEINAGRIPGPRILAAGMQLVKRSDSAASEDMFLEYDGQDSARSRVRYLVSLGADVIKIRLTRMRPIPALEEVRAIVTEAHRFGLRATVHTDVPADDLVNLAIEAGADGIEHNAPLRSQDAGVLSRMAQLHMSLMTGAGGLYLQRIDTTGLIDTLDYPQGRLLPEDVLSALRAGIQSLHKQTRDMIQSGWSPWLRQAQFIAEEQRARRAGVMLVFGTDCGAYGMVHGEQYKALYGESRMGLSPMDVIVMATRDAANAVGKGSEIGTVEIGKRADLIIVDANPLEDLRNLRLVSRVLKAGVAYDPAEMCSSSGHWN